MNITITNLETISSINNAKLKTLKKLALKKYREETGEFVVENLAIIRDALNGGYEFQRLFVTDDFLKKNKTTMNSILVASKASEKYLISNKVNKYFSQMDTPSGITAVYQSKINSLQSGDPVIYLNAISDPGNLGTILRTALAFGFNSIVIDETCVDIYNSKTIGAAKDAIFKLNICEDENRSWLEKNKNTMPIYATSSHDGTPLEKFKPKGIFCLVLGSESHGVSEEIRQLADEKIKISISDKIESLNVAAAAAILMYQLRKIN